MKCQLLADFASPPSCSLISIDSSSEVMGMAAAWKDTRFALAHGWDLEKVAVVGAPGWIKWTAGLSKGLIGGEVRFKQDLQILADEIGIEIRIAHYPQYEIQPD